EPAAAAPAKAWLAWRQQENLETAATALIVDDGDGPKVVAQRDGVVLVAWEGRAWAIASRHSGVKVRPCDDDAEAAFEDLTVTPVVPPGEAAVHVLADVKQRPAEGTNAIHTERVNVLAQLGPYVLVNHFMNSDICPIPAGGATWDVPRVIDLRTGALTPPMALYPADELAKATAEALPRAVAAVREEYPDAPAADVEKALALFALELAWDGAAARARLVFVGHSPHFEDPSGGDTGAATIDAPTLPAALAPFADAPPDAVVAFWKGGEADGKGFSALAPGAVAPVRAWLEAAPAK
ncbi:MAG: hypothetical protein KC635_14005, partial [Myxococcales bacterium]|nr:hypothetical protein [Myxococcales bacterium]